MKHSITLAVLCLGLSALASAQTLPFVSSATNPAPNVPGGYCDTASPPVYNYATNVYWYCVPNSTPPTNRGTWTTGAAASLPVSVTATPSGTCTGNGLEVLGPTGVLYTCQNGTWGQVASGTTTLAGDVTGASGANTVVKINGTALSGLATGILKNTTATGVPSIAASADILSACTTCVTSGAALTSTDLMTGAGAQGAQTPSALATLDGTGAMTATSLLAGGFLATCSSCAVFFNGSTIIEPTTNGNLKLSNFARTAFGLLQFGGTTSSFPALKVSSTSLVSRLSDDSADTGFQASKLTSNYLVSNGTAPTITGCGTISSQHGGVTAGDFTTNTTGTCAAAFALPTAPTGWVCEVSDITKHVAANIMMQSATSTTGCTVTGTTAASDVLTFTATAY